MTWRVLVLVAGAIWFIADPIDTRFVPFNMVLQYVVAQVLPRLVILALLFGAAYATDKWGEGRE